MVKFEEIKMSRPSRFVNDRDVPRLPVYIPAIESWKQISFLAPVFSDVNPPTPMTQHLAKEYTDVLSSAYEEIESVCDAIEEEAKTRMKLYCIKKIHETKQKLHNLEIEIRKADGEKIQHHEAFEAQRIAHAAHEAEFEASLPASQRQGYGRTHT